MKRLLTILTLTIIYSQALGQTTISKYKDNGVNGIKLRDPKTVEKLLGDCINYLDNNDDEKEVVNGDGKQLPLPRLVFAQKWPLLCVSTNNTAHVKSYNTHGSKRYHRGQSYLYTAT